MCYVLRYLGRPSLGEELVMVWEVLRRLAKEMRARVEEWEGDPLPEAEEPVAVPEWE